MYSRNLGKNTVRASPTYNASPPSYHGHSPSGESRYPYTIPPGYDGNRFSRRPDETSRHLGETEVKHHTAPVNEGQPYPVQRESPSFTSENEEAEEVSSVVSLPREEETKETRSLTNDPLGALISSLKHRVSSDDLLLIVIILMLAAEGENAELTILLLSLLLLVKDTGKE